MEWNSFPYTNKDGRMDCESSKMGLFFSRTSHENDICFCCFFSLCHSQTRFECFRSLKRSAWLLFYLFLPIIFLFHVLNPLYPFFRKKNEVNSLWPVFGDCFCFFFLFLTCHCRDISVISTVFSHFVAFRPPQHSVCGRCPPASVSLTVCLLSHDSLSAQWPSS